MTTTTDLVTASLDLPAPAKLLTTNAERTMHWSKRASITREWRRAAKLYARHQHLPAFQWASIAVDVTQCRGVLADVGAHHPVTKAVVDGLVDAGILPGDTSKYVRSIVHHPPQRGKANAIVIHLTGKPLEVSK